MKLVYHLNIQLDEVNSDFYFENQKVADGTITFLNSMLTEEAKKKLKITATIHKVYTGIKVAEEFIKGMELLGLVKD